MPNKKILAVIPARGNSKRIPKKNIKNFFDQPIIKYSIDVAVKSKCFDEVMVSTDDKKIAQMAKKYGAKIPFLRSTANSSDHATTADVLKEVLLQYQKQGKIYDYVCCIYATAPFITINKIKTAKKMIMKTGAGSVFPITRFSSPIQRSFNIDKSGNLKMNWPENENLRSQDIKPSYYDSGQFYFLNTKEFLKQRTLFAKKALPIIVSELETQDLDNKEDWKMAELKYEALKKRKNKINHFLIGKRKIGKGQPTFIVAEMSGNHNQSYKKALQIIDAAIEAGVDAIKLQTYTADTLTIDSNQKWFQILEGPWKGTNLYQLYKTAYTPWNWQAKLKKYAEKKGVILFSTPFDDSSVDFLESLNVQVYKVASFELVDIALLKKIAKTKKPVIISRGMASEKEIRLALKTLYQHGATQVAVLHCVSEYPAQSKDMNLTTIPDLAEKFNVVSGLSDHTLGIGASIAAVVLGASIIEKTKCSVPM